MCSGEKGNSLTFLKITGSESGESSLSSLQCIFFLPTRLVLKRKKIYSSPCESKLWQRPRSAGHGLEYATPKGG